MWSVEGGNVFTINLAAVDMGGLLYCEPVYCHRNPATQKPTYFISIQYTIIESSDITLHFGTVFNSIALLVIKWRVRNFFFFRQFVPGN